MKRVAAISLLAVIICLWLSSFPARALPDGAVARLGKGILGDIAFSPDGTMLTVASSIGVYLYNTFTLAEIGFLETNSWVSSVCFSPDGSLLVSWGRGEMSLWDMHSLRILETRPILEREGPVWGGFELFGPSVVYSPDGSLLANVGSRKIDLWEVSNRGFRFLSTLSGPSGGLNNIFSIVFSPDGNLLISASYLEVNLWDVSKRLLVEPLSFSDPYPENVIKDMAISPDGRLLAVGGGGGAFGKEQSLKLYTVPDLEEVAARSITLNGNYSLSFSPNGDLLAVNSDTMLELWSIPALKTIATPPGHTMVRERVQGLKSANSLAFSPDSSLLATGSEDGTVYLWDVFNHKEVTTLSGPDEIFEVTFSPNGSLLAIGGEGGMVKLWNASDYNKTVVLSFSGHTEEVTSVSFSPDGSLLASGSEDNTMKLWNISTRQEVAILRHSSGANSVAFSPDGSLLASGSEDDTVKLWDVSTHQGMATLTGHLDSVYSVAFSPDGSLLASGSYYVKLWDVSTRQNVATLTAHSDSVRSVAFSPDGRLLASGSEDDTVKLWDISTHQEVATLTGHAWLVSSVAFSPDGSLLASGSEDGTIVLWNVTSFIPTTQPPVAAFSFSPEEPSVNVEIIFDASSSYDPDGQIVSYKWDFGDGFVGEGETVTHSYSSTGSYAVKLTVADNEGARDFRIEKITIGVPKSKEHIATLWGHTDEVTSVAFSPDGRILASASWEAIRLWDVESREDIAIFGEGGYDIAFSPDGELLACGGNVVKLWDVENREFITALEGRGDDMLSVAFSPDGKLVAAGGGFYTEERGGGVIHLWNVETGERIATLEGHTDYVYSIAFSSDGRLLASGSGDRTIRLWDVESKESVAKFEGHYTVALSPDGRLLAFASRGGIDLWGLESRERIATIEADIPDVPSIVFSPGSRILATSATDSATNLYDSVIEFWDVQNRERIIAFSGHIGEVTSIAFSPDGELLASGSEDETVMLWDITSLLLPSSMNQPPVASFSFSPENPVIDMDIAFDASLANDPDGQIVSYEWDFGDGSAGEGKTTTHSYSADGVYEVTLTVTDDLGKTATVSKQVNIPPSIEGSWVELTNAPAGVLKLREAPGTTNKNGSAKADVLMLVPNGWALKVIDAHHDTEIHDGYIWWEVKNPGNNVTGWMASKELDENSITIQEYLSLGDYSEKVEILDSKEERTDEILEAIDHYYSGTDTHSTSLQTTNLYKSNDWGYNDNNPPGFRDENSIQRFKDNSFPIEIILAIAAQESGGFDLDNEVYGQDITGDFLNGGVGIMQVTGTANRGWGSNLKCYVDACKSADPSQMYSYPSGKRYRHKYYTNTRQGIYANVKDGLRILQASYDLSMAANAGKDETMSWIGAVWRYNHIPKPRWCPIREDSGEYLFNIAYRLGDLSPYFGDYQIKLSQYHDYGFLSDGEKSELVQKLENYEEALVCSPVEIRVYDSQGRVTGFVNGERLSDIPNSDSYENGLLIFESTDSYKYEVAGKEEGEYQLGVTHIENGETIIFTATGIPTTTNALHQYTIDWDALSKGEEGVTVEIDENADNVPERIITSDSELTQDEYLLATSVNPEGKLPTTWADLKQTKLFQNYPNPFNPDTWIPYILAEQNRVVIKIHDTTGKLVRTLDLGNKSVGVYLAKEKAAYWDGSNDVGESMASGVYFYTLHAGDYVATKKMIIAK